VPQIRLQTAPSDIVLEQSLRAAHHRSKTNRGTHETGRRFVAKPVAAPVPACTYASLGFDAHLLVEPGSPAHPPPRQPGSSYCPYSPDCVERLSGKCSAGVMVVYAPRYGEQEIPHRSLRRPRGVLGFPYSRAHGARTPQATRLKGYPQRRFLCVEEWLPLAPTAEGLPALERQ
jgi:hypothetical protein